MKMIRYYLSQVKFALTFLITRPAQYNVELKEQKKIIFFLAADYGNLGDIAITHAQRAILTSNFPGLVYIEVPKSDTMSAIKGLRRVMRSDDVVTIVGGGNMGDVYIGFERLRRLIVKKFHSNRIISFPQTIDFTDTRIGRREFNISRRVYSRHPRITLMAREQATYGIMNKSFSANIILMPDIVMSLDDSRIETRRDLSLAVLCVRNDREAMLSAGDTDNLDQVIKSLFNRVERHDTHIGVVALDANSGREELDKLWGVFSHAGLVVTDRLHGMIFCAITGTPCIALNNSNGKVAGVYNLWLKDFPYIHLCDSVDEIEDVDIQKLQESVQVYDPGRFDGYWDTIRREIEGEDIAG